MPLISITKTYLNGNILTETDLDNIRNSISTFLNTTGIDSTNVQVGGLIGANLANATVTQTQMAANSVGTTQLTSSAVGQPQRTALNYAASAGTPLGGTTITGSSVALDVSPLTGVTLTTIGRPVYLAITNPSSGSCQIKNTCGASFGQVTILLVRTGTSSASYGFNTEFTNPNNNLANAWDAPPPHQIDFAPAGTWTYKVQASSFIGGSTSTFLNCSLMAYEL